MADDRSKIFMIPRRMSVAGIVIISLVMVTTLLLATVGTINYLSVKEQQYSSLNAELSVITDQLASGLAIPLWNFDHFQIGKVMESTMKNRVIYGLIVKAEQRVYIRVRDTNWGAVEVDREFPSNGLLSQNQAVYFYDQVIGVVQVYVTPKFVQTELMSTLTSTLVIIILLDLALIVSLYLAFDLTVLKPLKSIERYAVNVSEGAPEPAEITETNFQGELNNLQSSIKKMVALLKQRFEDLQESEHRFRQVIKCSPIPIALYDQSGKITYFNDRFMDTFGYTLADVPDLESWWLRAYPDEIYRLQVLQKWTDLVAEATRNGHDIETHVYQVTCKDGKVLSVEIFGTLIGNLNLVIFNDVTKIRLAEAERLQFENRVRQSQKMEAIGTLAGGIAHDFNNLLSVIIGNIELAQIISAADLKRANYLEQSLKACLRAKDLVGQILAFSRQGESDPVPVSLGPILYEELKLLRSTIPTSVEIRDSICRESLIVKSNPVQIQQILINLSTNAAHAMRETGGILEIRLEKIDIEQPLFSSYDGLASGPYACLTVSDTGSGMDRETMDRIFEPFFTTKAQGEGTGLGLAVVYGIVKSYGGDIKVYSEIGQGTTFRVYLPLAEKEPIKPPGLETKLLAGGTERILFVDDEEAVAQVGTEMLQYLGYQVTTHTSSPEALALFQASPLDFDLVITDQTMPKLTGVELAKKIMKIRPEVPIILCTGFSQLVSNEYVEQIGIRRLLMKPYVLRNVSRTVRAVLDD